MEFLPAAWTDAELDRCIPQLCDQFAESRMIACSPAVEYRRRVPPRASAESLLSAMRGLLQQEAALQVAPGGQAAQIAAAMRLVEVSQRMTRAGIQEMLARSNKE